MNYEALSQWLRSCWKDSGGFTNEGWQKLHDAADAVARVGVLERENDELDCKRLALRERLKRIYAERDEARAERDRYDGQAEMLAGDLTACQEESGRLQAELEKLREQVAADGRLTHEAQQQAQTARSGEKYWRKENEQLRAELEKVLLRMREAADVSIRVQCELKEARAELSRLKEAPGAGCAGLTLEPSESEARLLQIVDRLRGQLNEATEALQVCRDLEGLGRKRWIVRRVVELGYGEDDLTGVACGDLLQALGLAKGDFREGGES